MPRGSEKRPAISDKVCPAGFGAAIHAHKGEFMARTYLLLAIALTGLITPGRVQAQNQSFPLPPFLTPRGTPEDQRACRSDAVKFCKDMIDNDDAVLRCFQANRVNLTPGCQAVLEKYGR